jgi:hypothetical protein
MLRYLGIITRPSRAQCKSNSKQIQMVFASSDEQCKTKNKKKKKKKSWVLSSTPNDLKVKQFIVAVDGIVRHIGAAPQNVSEYVDKVGFKQNSGASFVFEPHCYFHVTRLRETH